MSEGNYESLEGARETLELRGGRAIQLRSDGLSHPVSVFGGPEAFTPYEQVTHLELGRSFVWLGTERSVYLWSRRSFLNPMGPEVLRHRLLAVLSNRAGGADQLEAMSRVDAWAARPRTWWVPLIFGLCCVAALAVGSADRLFEAGYYSTPLVRDGDVWRVLTSQVVHWGAGDLFPTLALLLPLVWLLERGVGTARAALVLFGGALGGLGLTAFLQSFGAAGLGLGLFIVRNLVRRQGGRVVARSEGAGEGSRFVVTLRAVRGAVA